MHSASIWHRLGGQNLSPVALPLNIVIENSILTPGTIPSHQRHHVYGGVEMNYLATSAITIHQPGGEEMNY